MLAVQQVQDVAVAVGEENQRIAAGRFATGQERDGLGLQTGEDGVEIGDGEGQMTEAGVAHGLRARGSIGFDDLDHGAVMGFEENRAGTGRAVVDGEIEVVDVPLGKLHRVGRGDGGMFDASYHSRIVTTEERAQGDGAATRAAAPLCV